VTEKRNEIYPIQKKDIRRAAAVLADAFQRDPVWNAILSDATVEQREAAFQTPVRYGLKYGEIYAPSENLEGIASWVPGKLSNMTVWRVLLSGALWPGLKLGPSVAKKMGPIFGPIETDRKAHMAGRPFIYLQILGVAPAYQGRGYGGKLIRSLIESSEQARLPIYLETETEGNVRLYEHFGFRVLQQITLPLIDLPMWEMVRD
jgi:ribosomal protein S18 acetylase RimI-like enzyme